MVGLGEPDRLGFGVTLCSFAPAIAGVTNDAIDVTGDPGRGDGPPKGEAVGDLSHRGLAIRVTMARTSSSAAPILSICAPSLLQYVRVCVFVRARACVYMS